MLIVRCIACLKRLTFPVYYCKLGVRSSNQKHTVKVQQKLIVRCIACGSLLSIMGVKSSILGDAAESTAEVNCQVVCLFEEAPFPSILGVYFGVSKVQQKLIVRWFACLKRLTGLTSPLFLPSSVSQCHFRCQILL